MFNLSPTHQFLIQKGLQALAGQQGQPGQQGQMPRPMPSPMLRNPAGMQTPPQSMPGQMGLPAQPAGGNVNPGIMNRFKSLVTNQLPPQLRALGASQMMPPQS